MNIDRHNYEEYFLLYVDNELNVDQVKQVELFVKQNPDLEEELVMLKHSKLTPDHSLVFANKNMLMKDEGRSFINMDNYEEWLVLYVDNELSQEERSVIEKFASAHPRVQQELALFKATRLEPEEIVFANKENLYKKERVAVITMQWWKIAVAAILIVAGSITLYSVFNARVGKGNNALSSATSSKTNDKTSSEQPVSTTAKVTPIVKDEQALKVKKQDQQLAITIPARKIEVKKSTPQGKKDEQKEVQENSGQLASNNLPTDTSQRRQYAMTESIAPNVAETQVRDAVVKSDRSHEKIFNTNIVTNPNLDSPHPIYASNDDRGENKKLRGFFRKATRLIERTTNINPANDDNKVLIGGMAINLK